MLKVGLTGGIGSGKTTVANLFKQHGVTIIDADEIALSLSQQGSEYYDKIVQYFGDKFVREDGELNRKLIREIVFADNSKRKWLEELLHPAIINQLTDKMMSVTSAYCIAVVPLLVEAHLENLFDRILVVDTDEETQLQRTLARDHLEARIIKQTIQAQTSREQRLKIATDIITNNGDLKNLEQQVGKLHKQFANLQ